MLPVLNQQLCVPYSIENSFNADFTAFSSSSKYQSFFPFYFRYFEKYQSYGWLFMTSQKKPNWNYNSNKNRIYRILILSIEFV